MTHSLPSEVTSHRCSWYVSATAATRNSALTTLLLPTTRKDPLWFFFAPASGSCMGAYDWQSLGHTVSPNCKAGWESPSSASPEGSKFASCHDVQGKKSHNWKRVQNPSHRILIVIVITDKSAFHEFRCNPRECRARGRAWHDRLTLQDPTLSLISVCLYCSFLLNKLSSDIFEIDEWSLGRKSSTCVLLVSYLGWFPLLALVTV